VNKFFDIITPYIHSSNEATKRELLKVDGRLDILYLNPSQNKVIISEVINLIDKNLNMYLRKRRSYLVYFMNYILMHH
jgi:hypothetical protein